MIKVSCGRYFQVVSGVDTLVLAHFATLISRFIGHRPSERKMNSMEPRGDSTSNTWSG